MLISPRDTYPGSVPLDGGKDLRPASSLLLGVDLDYKDPTPLEIRSRRLLSGWLGFLSLIPVIDLRSRTLLIKVDGSLDLQLVPSHT